MSASKDSGAPVHSGRRAGTPSLRAQQRQLRNQMRAAGIETGGIAAEFASRYGLRPRAAWRQAHGWSLVKAAECINREAFAAGMHPGGNAMVMTAAHLCDHETWPGPGNLIIGRKPTARVLALLARAYGAGITQLLDVDDYASLPAVDRLIIETFMASPDTCADSPAGTLAFRPGLCLPGSSPAISVPDMDTSPVHGNAAQGQTLPEVTGGEAG